MFSCKDSASFFAQITRETGRWFCFEAITLFFLCENKKLPKKRKYKKLIAAMPTKTKKIICDINITYCTFSLPHSASSGILPQKPQGSPPLLRNGL